MGDWDTDTEETDESKDIFLKELGSFEEYLCEYCGLPWEKCNCSFSRRIADEWQRKK